LSADADAARGAAERATGVVEHESAQSGGPRRVARDAIGDEGGGQVRVPRVVGFDDVLSGVGAELEKNFGVAGAGGGNGQGNRPLSLALSPSGGEGTESPAALDDGEGHGHSVVAVAGVVDPGAQGFADEGAGLGFLVVAGANVDLAGGGGLGGGAEINGVGDASAHGADTVVATASVAAHRPPRAGFSVGVGKEWE